MVERIEVASDAAFSCGRCNKCCRGEWIIGITAQEAESLRALYPAIDPVQSVIERRGDDLFYSLARREDGACVFLDPDGCRVHKEHGEAAKPAICRRFPFAFRRAGSALYLHLSRVCPSVYAARGARGATLLADAARVPLALDTPSVMMESVNLAGTVTVNGDQYLKFENRLLELILDERWPLDDCMAAGVILLQRLVEDQSRTENQSQAETPDVNPLPGDDWAMDLVLEAIARRSPMIGLYRYIMATVVTVIESRRQGKVFSTFLFEDMMRYLKMTFARGHDRLLAIDRDVDYARVSRIHWPHRKVPSLTPLRSYLASHIHAKLLLTSPDVEFGYHLLLGAYATVKFYARASATASGRETLHANDLEVAIQAVECHLLLHPQHLPSMERRLVRGWFRKFLFHPSFPSSMAYL